MLKAVQNLIVSPTLHITPRFISNSIENVAIKSFNGFLRRVILVVAVQSLG